MRGIFSFVVAVLVALSATAAQAPPGELRLSAKRTPDGVAITSRTPGNRFTFEVKAKAFAPVRVRTMAPGGGPEVDVEGPPVWSADGMFLQVTAVPIPDDRPDATPEETLKSHQKGEAGFRTEAHGRVMVAGSESFLTAPGGRKILTWEMEPGPPRKDGAKGEPGTIKADLYATTINTGNVVEIVCTVPEGVALAAARQFLRATALTLKPAAPPDAEAQNAPARGLPPVEELGGDAFSPARLNEFFTGEASRTLLNRALMTPRDARAPDKVVMTAREITDLIRFAVGVEGESMLMVSLFDGSSSHSVNIDRVSGDRFVYWEPRGGPSFLAASMNKAKVAARQVDAKSKLWSVSRDEFERVVYAATVEETTYDPATRFLKAMRGDPEKAIASYTRLKADNPDGEEVGERRLVRGAEFLLANDEAGAAHTAFRVALALYPNSPEAQFGLSRAEYRLRPKAPEPAPAP